MLRIQLAGHGFKFAHCYKIESIWAIVHFGALNYMALVLSPPGKLDSAICDFDDFEGRGSFDDLPLHTIDSLVCQQYESSNEMLTRRVGDLQEQLRSAQEQLREAKRLTDRMTLVAETSRLEIENLRKENKELKSQSLSCQIDAARKKLEDADQRRHYIEVAANAQFAETRQLRVTVDKQTRELRDKTNKIHNLETACAGAVARMQTTVLELVETKKQLQQAEIQRVSNAEETARIITAYNAERSMRVSAADEISSLKSRLYSLAYTAPISRQQSEPELFTAKKRTAAAMLSTSSESSTAN